MKRITAFFTVLLMALAFCSCGDRVVDSVGKPISEQVFVSGEFQDYTDFGIYKFESADFSENEYFTRVTPELKTEFISYIADYESVLDSIKRNDANDSVAVNYNFHTDLITENDYVYIYDKCDHEEFYKDKKYANYDIYFFDYETVTLYYFHNNI